MEAQKLLVQKKGHANKKYLAERDGPPRKADRKGGTEKKADTVATIAEKRGGIAVRRAYQGATPERRKKRRRPGGRKAQRV